MFYAGQTDYIAKLNGLVAGTTAFAALLVGVGVSWAGTVATDTGEGAVQVGARTSIIAPSAGVAGYFAQNAYHDGTNWKYIATDEAALYGVESDGKHIWYGVVSGTAGSTITWTEWMRLNSAGLSLTVALTVPSAQNIKASDGTSRIYFETSSYNAYRSGSASGSSHIFQDSAGTNQFGSSVTAFSVYGINLSINAAAVALGHIVYFGDTGYFRLGRNSSQYFLFTGTAVANYLDIGPAGIGKPSYIRSVTTGQDLYLQSAQNILLQAGGAVTIAAVQTGGLYVANRTGAALADYVDYYSSDLTAGNTIPSFYCEGGGVVGAGITSTTVTHKVAMRVNGTVYYILATTNGT
jgi:hypothetical protein